MNLALWIAQGLLALSFVGGGIWKLTTPIDKLAQMIPWAGEKKNLLYTTAIIDVLGGLGVVLPMATHIMPALTIAAAAGCALLMLSAIVFHFSRGEQKATPFNFFLLALSVFVLWGRLKAAPIT